RDVEYEQTCANQSQKSLLSFHSVSAFESKALDRILDTTELIGIVGKRPFCSTGSGDRPFSLTENQISPQKPLPPLDVASIFLQPVGKATNHIADHIATVFLAHGPGRGNIVRGRTPRRMSWRVCT